jgi:hypothetical protein
MLNALAGASLAYSSYLLLTCPCKAPCGCKMPTFLLAAGVPLAYVVAANYLLPKQ